MDPQNGHEDNQHTDHDPSSEAVDPAEHDRRSDAGTDAASARDSEHQASNHHSPDTVPDWSELGRGTRKTPKGVREILKAYFNDTQIDRADQYHSFFSSWKQLAGINISAHTHPRDIRGGVLIVEADHPGWVQLLHMQKRSILRKINREYPQLEVKEIRIVVGGGGERSNATDRSAPAAPADTPATQKSASGAGMPRESAAAPSSGRRAEGPAAQPDTTQGGSPPAEEPGAGSSAQPADQPAAESPGPPEDPQHKNRFEEALKKLGERVEEHEQEGVHGPPS